VDFQAPGKRQCRARDRSVENEIPGAHEKRVGRRPYAEPEKHHGPKVYIEPLQSHPDRGGRRPVIRDRKNDLIFMYL